MLIFIPCPLLFCILIYLRLSKYNYQSNILISHAFALSIYFISRTYTVYTPSSLWWHWDVSRIQISFGIIFFSIWNQNYWNPSGCLFTLEIHHCISNLMIHQTDLFISFSKVTQISSSINHCVHKFFKCHSAVRICA